MKKYRVVIKVPGDFSGKVYGAIPEFGKTTKEEWQQDGSWVAVVEIPGGMQENFYQKLNELTRGQVETKLL